MHPTIKLVTKAMVADLGDAIARQVRDYADGESFSEQNPIAMRKALEWLVTHDRMLEQALSGEGYEAVFDMAAEIELALDEASR